MLAGWGVVAFTQSLTLIRAQKLSYVESSWLGVAKINDKKEGEIIIRERNKKQETFQEQKHQVTVPRKVGEQEKKALDETGDDATSGW
jgi:hypothetical protein